MNYKELNLIGSSSPHIRTKDGAGHIMGEVLLAMLLPLLFAVYNFGPRALAATAVSVAGCCAFEWLYRAALKKDNTLGDLSAAVTGVLIAFVCPVTIPYWMLLIGDFFAIVVVKPEPRPGGPCVHALLGRGDEHLGRPPFLRRPVGRCGRGHLPHPHGPAP